jgi:hypothetical protein
MLVLQHYRDEGTVILFRKLVEMLKGHEACQQLPNNIVNAVIQEALAPFTSYINPNTRRLKREHLSHLSQMSDQIGGQRPRCNVTGVNVRAPEAKPGDERADDGAFHSL